MKKPANTLAMLAFASILTAACQNAQTPPAAVSAPVPETSETPIPVLVQAVCGDCHGVERPFLSPNPEAPAFDAIVNEQGLTHTSLAKWLIDAHNYPMLMEFELSKEDAQVVADYMVTLQRENYRPEQ